jgi:hypothetical protein
VKVIPGFELAAAVTVPKFEFVVSKKVALPLNVGSTKVELEVDHSGLFTEFQANPPDQDEEKVVTVAIV